MIATFAKTIDQTETVKSLGSIFEYSDDMWIDYNRIETRLAVTNGV
jgi:hypothetical protein